MSNDHNRPSRGGPRDRYDPRDERPSNGRNNPRGRHYDDNPHNEGPYSDGPVHAHYESHSRRDREGYAYRAGEPGPGPNLYHLRRDPANGMIAGVCAGIARHFGYPVEWVRIGWVASAFFSGTLSIFAYIACAIFIRPEGRRPASFKPSPEEEKFWRTFSSRPRSSLAQLKHRFRALDARISDMEYTVTSDEYGLRKAFDDLENTKPSG
ncbi:MAG: envelope stress response membrane protein PspC [Pseudomonadota bacterium]